ncbi:MAG: M23 family metallopeptidase [Myxococcaceae bacterium]
MRAVFVPVLLWCCGCATAPEPKISFEDATREGARGSSPNAKIGDALDRFSEGARIRRDAARPGSRMTNAQADAWSQVLDDVDRFLSVRAGPAWLDEAGRVRLKLEGEFHADAQRFGDVPEVLAERVTLTLKKLSSRIASQSPHVNAFKPQALRWPLDLVVVSSPYGSRVHPVKGGEQFHAGIDLEAPISEPVFAAESGVVTFAEWNGGHGNQIELKHDAHWATRYSHLDQMLVASGTRVKKGQRIGLVGDTGMTTGPHLHFELRRDGDALDPEAFLRAPPGQLLMSGK